MVTKAYKCLVAMMLSTSGSNNPKGTIKAKNIIGTDYYLGPKYSAFPYSYSQMVQVSGNNAGIYIGSGNSPESDSSYALESKISSGFTANTPTVTCDNDANDNPVINFDFTITNTGASDLVIKEIGYAQDLKATTTKGGYVTSQATFLLDRTVLSNPITIPAGEYAAVRYTLKSIVPASIRP